MTRMIVKLAFTVALSVCTMPNVGVAGDGPETVDPVEIGTQALKTLGSERSNLVQALERMNKDQEGVEKKLASLYGSLESTTCELRSLHGLIGKGCYPFKLRETTYPGERAAVARTSTLMALAESLRASIAILESNLDLARFDADQMTVRILQHETEIALVPLKTTRTLVPALPRDSAPLLEVLNALLPQETTEMANHRLRVAAFLAAPLDGESITAEGSGNAAVR